MVETSWREILLPPTRLRLLEKLFLPLKFFHLGNDKNLSSHILQLASKSTCMRKLLISANFRVHEPLSNRIKTNHSLDRGENIGMCAIIRLRIYICTHIDESEKGIHTMSSPSPRGPRRQLFRKLLVTLSIFKHFNYTHTRIFYDFEGALVRSEGCVEHFDNTHVMLK